GLGFFTDAGPGRPGGYVAGFRVACACDLALALGSLALSRLLAPPRRSSPAALPGPGQPEPALPEAALPRAALPEARGRIACSPPAGLPAGLRLGRDGRRAVAEPLDQHAHELLAGLHELVLRHGAGQALSRLREHRRPERDRDERQRQQVRVKLRVDLA